MDLLKQCQQWFEQNEIQKVIDALEAIPAKERTPELDSELAKAYIAIAEVGEEGRMLYEKALELLAPHEEYFAGDHCWNYRIASAYYYLDEEGPALRYFEKALKARPGDKDTQEYIDDCRRRLSLPRFEKNFRERTQEAWAAFTQIEGSLRQIMDTDETHQRGEELIETCGNALKIALRDTSFELGFNGEKYELILSPEGLRSRLFPLVYFQQQAPESVLEHWNIWVGRQPSKDFMLRAGDIEIRAEDVQMWAEKTEDQRVSLVLCCEKLTPLLKEDTDRVWWALSMLVDQTIGEVSAIAFVAGFDVYVQPKDEPAMLLSELPELLQSMGLSLWRDGSDYLENSYLAYELEPVEDPEADWRLDVYTGTCRLPVIINDYMTARSDAVDEYHKDGIAVGFLCYPLEGFTGDERSNAILDFRDDLRDAILRDAGAEAVTFLGGATGLYCGYLDFIAWDLPAVLTAAQAFFEGRDLPYYTLVTMGMGAHRMNVPEELAEYKLERAELAIALPPDWKLDEESLKDERWYWPIGLLKVLARLPISGDTWLGFGHTMDKQSPFAENTTLCGALLVGPQDVVWNGGEVCTLPSCEEVNFYQVIPLYRNELKYKLEHDADALLEKMAGISFVVNPTRQNAITRGALADESFTGDMDDAAWNLESFQEKGLPVDEINAYNHMAIYLRWCMEHDLMSVEFMERYWEQVQPFMADLSCADLRGFIRDQLNGQLFGALFNKEGAAFASYYYGEGDSPYFPSDIDNYALGQYRTEKSARYRQV